MITYDLFKNIELKTALVKNAQRVDGSDKLIQLDVMAGDVDDMGVGVSRQLIAGIGKKYEPEQLVGKTIVIVANLEPKTFKIKTEGGEIELESKGMLLAASNENEGPVLLTTMEYIGGGSGVR